jgi:hypothetical protein
MVIAQRSAAETGVVVIRDVPGLDLKAGRRTTSEPLLNAIAVLRGLSEPLLAQVNSISARTVDGTSLYTRDRVEVVFGSAADAGKKSKLVLGIMDQMRDRVVSIDVRTIDHPTAQGL